MGLAHYDEGDSLVEKQSVVDMVGLSFVISKRHRLLGSVVYLVAELGCSISAGVAVAELLEVGRHHHSLVVDDGHIDTQVEPVSWKHPTGSRSPCTT